MLREIISNEWFTIFILIGLILITMSKYFFVNRFYDFISVLGNSKYLKIYSRDQKFIDSFDTLLFGNLVLSLSIFAFVAYSTLVEPISFDFAPFVKLIFGIAAVLLIKVLLERLIGSVFEIDALIDSYIFQKTSYRNFSGLILLPINCILLYALSPTNIIIYIIIGLMIIINIIGFITSVKSHQNLIINNLFYFILYLCALEIGPYLILYTLIIRN